MATSQDADHTYGIDPGVFHRRRQILAVLCLSLVIIVMAVSSLNVAIPSIVEGLRASSTETLWIIEAYALVFAGLLLPAGALGDRFGRKKTLLIGLTIFAVMTLVAGLSVDATQLIIARAVMGVGAALIMPATLSIITHVFPPHERGKAIATWAGFAGAGGALGPLLSGLILRAFGREHWGAVFFINIPLTLLLMILVWKLVPDSKDPTGHALDPAGAMISIVALGVLVFGIIEAPRWGWTAPSILACLAISLAAVALFIVVENRIAHPMLDPKLFRLRGFSMGTLTITIAFFSMFGMYLLLALYLQFVQGHSPLDSAVRTLPAAATMIIVAPRSPILARRLGMRRLIRLGFSLVAIGMAGMATLQAGSSYAHFVVSLIVLASGMAMCMAPTTASIIASLPLAKAGVGSAVNDVSREVGGAVGIAVLGSLLADRYHSHMARAIVPFQADIPAAARGPVIDSIQAAFSVAEEAPAKSAALLRAAARESFVSGLHLPLWVACGAALVAMVVISSNIPDTPPLGEAHT